MYITRHVKTRFMQSELGREHLAAALEAMKRIADEDPTAEVLIITDHDPTDVTPEWSEWKEYREGNRTFTVTVRETHPKEYYLNKYGIVK